MPDSVCVCNRSTHEHHIKDEQVQKSKYSEHGVSQLYARKLSMCPYDLEEAPRNPTRPCRYTFGIDVVGKTKRQKGIRTSGSELAKPLCLPVLPAFGHAAMVALDLLVVERVCDAPRVLLTQATSALSTVANDHVGVLRDKGEARSIGQQR